MIREVFESEEWIFPTIVYRPEKLEGELPLIIQLHGAGDIFGGSAVSRLLELEVAPEKLNEEQLTYVGSFASTAASLSTEKQGGIPSIPDEDVVKSYQ